MGKSNVLNH